MNIPKGFIKDSNGVYRRGNYIYSGGEIIKESTLLPNEESLEEVKEVSEYDTLDEAIRLALSYNSDLGNPTRKDNIYIVESKGKYSISDKDSKNAVAIITPDNNVYETKFTEVINQDDNKELKSDDKDNAKAPKEIKEIETDPVNPEELKEAENTKCKIEIIINGELTYLGKMNEKEIQDVLSTANSIDHNTASTDEDKCMESDETEDEVTEETTDEEETDKVTTGMAKFVKEPIDIKELIDSQSLVTPAAYVVKDSITLSKEEFEDYLSNLRQDKEFLSKFKPDNERGTFTCIEVKSEEGPTLLIDNSKTSAAKYVAIL